MSLLSVWSFTCSINLNFYSQLLRNLPLGISTSESAHHLLWIIRTSEILPGHFVMSLRSQIRPAVSLWPNSKSQEPVRRREDVGEKGTYRWLRDWEMTRVRLASCSHLAYMLLTPDGALGNVAGQSHSHRRPEEGTINVHQLARDVYSLGDSLSF